MCPFYPRTVKPFYTARGCPTTAALFHSPRTSKPKPPFSLGTQTIAHFPLDPEDSKPGLSFFHVDCKIDNIVNGFRNIVACYSNFSLENCGNKSSDDL